MADTTPQAVQAAHELLLWIIPQIDKFPRVRRFTLGERLESMLLEVLEATVEAAFSARKQAALDRANLRLETARHLWRLAFELRAVAARSHEHGARLMDELGRQLGGWRFVRQYRGYARAWAEGRLDWDDFAPSVQGWIGHAAHADTAILILRWCAPW